MANEPGKKGRSQFYFMQIALSFGLGLGVRIFVFGFIGGGFLDDYFGTYPYITFLGILLAIFMSFYRLLKALPPANFRKIDKAKKDEEE